MALTLQAASSLDKAIPISYYVFIIWLTNPFEKIAGANGKIYEFAKERNIIASSYKNRLCMEDVFEKDNSLWRLADV